MIRVEQATAECLGYRLEQDLSINECLRRTLLVYLDMIGSTYLKKRLEEHGSGLIFKAFHRVLRAIERELANKDLLRMDSRVGDALLFTSRSADGEHLNHVAGRVLHLINDLGELIKDASKDTVLNDQDVRFRAGLHVGPHYFECDIPQASCIRPTEVVSLELDLVTKLANLSRYEGAVLLPAISTEVVALMRRKPDKCIVAIGEDTYLRITAELYRRATKAPVYSVVDFSIFDDEVLKAIRAGARCLHMTGWLLGRHEATFGALLRKSIAPDLDLRLARSQETLFTRSLIASKAEAVAGQTFTFGRGGRHFLVGEHVQGAGASKVHKDLAQNWDDGTLPGDDTDAILRERARGAARGRTLTSALIDDQWLQELTGLDRKSRESLMDAASRVDAAWRDRIVAYVQAGKASSVARS